MKEYTNRMLNRRHRFLILTTAVLLAAISAPPLRAQAPEGLPAGPITLEQALSLAERLSEAIAISRAEVDRADGDVRRARSGRYPQLSVAASYDRALASEFSGLFENIDTGTETGGFEDLPFGRSNTFRAALVLSQNVYSGGRLGAEARVAAAGREVAALDVLTTRASLLFETTQAYYDAALSDRLVQIAEATLEQAGATLRQTQAGFDAGTQPEFEVIRARVTRDSQTPLVIRARTAREVALLRLKQLLDLPQDFNLQLAYSLGDERLPPPPVFAPRVAPFEISFATENPAAAPLAAPADAALPERTVVNEASATVRLRQASLQRTEAERKPSVALNSTYARLAYPRVFPAFDRTNWSVGATFSLPVLTGGRQRGDEQVARAELEQSRLRLRLTQELAALDTRQTWAELLAARAAWEATAGTVQQATRAYEIANVRFGAGVSTQLELSDARLLLQQAETNRAQAARDLQVARARMALVPDLPLGNSVLPRLLPETIPQTVPTPRTNSPAINNVTTVPGGGFQLGTTR